MAINDIYISDIIQARRMDPIFFRYGTSLFGQKYKLESIGSCIIDMQSGVGAGKSDQASAAIGIVQIRPTNIDKDGILVFDKNVYVPTEANMPSLKYNDVLFNNTNSQELVGKTAIFRGNEAYKFSNHITRIRVNQDKILPDYLWLILNIYQRKSIFYSICTNWNNQSGVGNELLKSTKIPLPTLKEQKEIVNHYTKAQKAKQAKDEEAKSLLESINAFLLEVLDITSNQQYEKKSIFSTTISNLVGQRLDVSSYKEHFEMISNKYPNRKLSSLVEIDPAIKFSELNKDTTISFIPMECIDEKYGEISEQREISISQIKGYTKFVEGDLLWAKITPCMQNGKSAIARHLKNSVGCGSTEYYVIRPKTEDLLIDYVYLILRHPEVLKSAQNSFGGSAGQQRVSSQYIKSIVIPYPSKDIQQSIVDVAFERKQKAKRLKKEGIELLEQTKQEIEKRILG